MDPIVPIRLFLAWRNVFRQKARSAATLAAISIGVAGIILAGGFVQDIFVQLGEAIISSQTGHIQVSRRGFAEGKYRNPEAYYIDRPEELKTRLQRQPGVANVLSRLIFSGVLNNGRRDLAVIGEGIEPGKEAALGTYLSYLEGRALEEKDIDGLVAGEGVAKSLGLKIGDRVTLVTTLAEGAVNTLDFELVGVFRSFSKDFDARAVRLPLAAARNVMATNSAHLLVVMLRETEATDSVLEQVRADLGSSEFEVASWKKLSDFYDKTVELYDRQFGVLRLIIMLMVLLSVTNSVNMNLFERTREFGTMMAVGDRPGIVYRSILIESLLLGAFGALLGIVLGVALALLISIVGIPMPPPPNTNMEYTAMIRLVPLEIIVAALIGFAATFLAALLPAHRVAKLNVVDALRHGV